MNLIMFDIDGTLVDSMNIDEIYFESAIKDALAIHQIDTNWRNYSHATDSCILQEIVERKLGKSVTKAEITKFITIFTTQLNNHFSKNPGSPVQISGSGNFIKELQSHNFALSIATGGYKEPAQLKLRKAFVEINNIPFACSHDGISREEIMTAAEKKAKDYYGVGEFDEIFYFGDALWDYKACKNLNYRFIAVSSNKEKFNGYELEYIIENFCDTKTIFDIINSTFALQNTGSA